MWLDPAAPIGPSLTDQVGEILQSFVAQKRSEFQTLIEDQQTSTGFFFDVLSEYVSGGKRIRPGCLVWGYASVDGSEPTREIVTAASSLDLLHASALVHDDVIDGSETRRGKPSAQIQFETLHDKISGGPAESFGEGAAIVLGDLMIMWSIELFNNSGLSQVQLSNTQALLASMREEVTLGQYLDLTSQAQPLNSAWIKNGLRQAEQVIDYKTSQYTLIRPLQIGAKLAGASSELLNQLAQIGYSLGRAFQYRDDLLGSFGDESITGKPAADDISEGKRTVLLNLAFKNADAEQRAELVNLIGNSTLTDRDVQQARTLLVSTGAVFELEKMIAHDVADAKRKIEDSNISELAKSGLKTLADQLVDRAS